MDEQISFRDIVNKWVSFPRKKDLKKICKKCGIKLEDGLFFAYSYIDRNGELSLKLAGFMKKNKDILSFDDELVSKNISLKLKDYPKLEFQPLDEDLSEFVKNADTVKFSSKLHEAKDSLNLEKTRNMKEIDPYRSFYFPDDISVSLKTNDLYEDIDVQIKGLYENKDHSLQRLVCKLLRDSINDPNYRKNNIVMVKMDFTNKEHPFEIEQKVEKK